MRVSDDLALLLSNDGIDHESDLAADLLDARERIAALEACVRAGETLAELAREQRKYYGECDGTCCDDDDADCEFKRFDRALDAFDAERAKVTL